MAIAGLACGAIYVVLSPQPTIKRTASAPPPRLLPYEKQISKAPEPAAAPQESASEGHAISPVETETVKAAPKPDAQAAAAAEESAETQADHGAQENAGSSGAMPPSEDADANDGTAMTPDDGVNPADQTALPPDSGDGSYEVTAVPPGAAPPGGPYGDAPQGAPYGAAPPNAPYGAGAPYGPDGAGQGEPGEGPGEWVQVLVSGAGMYATASDDAPMLFAFPYGRGLKVVSRYENWVEVTDPQSSATGWMKSQYLAPVAAAPGPPEETAGYEDARPGWFRRHRNGLADLIGRALGGGF